MVTWREASPEDILRAEEDAIRREEADMESKHVGYLKKVLDLVYDSVIGKKGDV